jgi:hypothetical protein
MKEKIRIVVRAIPDCDDWTVHPKRVSLSGWFMGEATHIQRSTGAGFGPISVYLQE